jgi:ParB family chromosome partitioning protein
MGGHADALTKKGTEMTDTLTTAPDDTATAEDRATGTIEHIDPNVLTLDLNVRDEADLDAEFVASIKDNRRSHLAMLVKRDKCS